MKFFKKEESVRLRKKGLSINEIAEKVEVSKSSVSLWVRDIVLTKSQRKRISLRGRSIDSIEKRRASRLLSEKNKRNLISIEAKKDISSLDRRDLKLIGICLYWGEGGKSRRGSVRLSNSDPSIIKIMMRFFREVCEVPEKKFRGHIHTHYGVNVSKAINYWSNISGIPKKHFYKTYVKKFNGKIIEGHVLFYGTFDIYVNDTRLFTKIMAWIDAVREKLI